MAKRFSFRCKFPVKFVTRVERVEVTADNLTKDTKTISDQINIMRLEMLQGFNEIKLQLKDKQDRENNR